MTMTRIGRVVLLAAVLAPALGGAAPAGEDKRLPSGRAEMQLSFAPLVKRAAPAVVNIYAKRVVKSAPVSPFFNDPFFRRFFGEDFSFGRPRERVQNSLGSGVVVRGDGLVVTNHHVIKDASEITVVFADRREFDARLVGSDERTDLAVLRIDPAGQALPFLQIRDSDDLEVGDLVLAIGNPFGVGQTVTGGIVSALARNAAGISDFGFFIQTDAAINPGNSGGALVSLDGRLVGINTAIYSRGGGSVGIGFAIPSNMVAMVVDSVDRSGRVVRPWLGARTQDVTAAIAASLGRARPEGAIVRRVYPGGPTDRAGLRVGDVILAVDGRRIDDRAGLAFRIATLRLGTTAELTVLRGGERRRLRFDVAQAPEIPPRNVTGIEGRHPFSGAAMADLSPALAEELRIEGPERGVVVMEAPRGTTAGRLGFRRGDVVLKVNGREPRSVAGLERLLHASGDRWRISLLRDGKALSFVFGA